MASASSLAHNSRLPESAWPDSAQAELARRILPDYLRLGAGQFVANADDAEVRAVVAGDHVLPVVWRTGRGNSPVCDVCSPWSHYVLYPQAEMKRHQGLGSLVARGLLLAAVPLLYASRIDDVISVNNWLLTTNPPVALDCAQITRLTEQLCGEYRARAIVFRTVNPALAPEFAANLRACGYRMVAARTVYVLDPLSRHFLQCKNVARDRRLLHAGDYEIVPHEDLRAQDMPRLAELHRLLYIEKYTELNPEFLPLFFETAWRNRFSEFRALRKDGLIDAYVSWYQLGGVLFASLLGYDTRLPESIGLYRRAFAIATEEARVRRMLLHMSAGCGQFKYFRAARPCVEYDAIYDRHLPVSRRAGWRLLEIAGLMQRRKVQRGW